jgi:biotin-(acetyl-CoA carboxylase) ligase
VSDAAGVGAPYGIGGGTGNGAGGGAPYGAGGGALPPLITRVVRLGDVDSTNSYARALAEARPFEGGIAVIAEQQSSGKGRLGRTWLSQRGKSLSMSILLRARPESGASALISLAAACSVAKAIDAVCAGAAPPAMIKWPNDIVIGGKKVCGILVEAGAATWNTGTGGETAGGAPDLARGAGGAGASRDSGAESAPDGARAAARAASPDGSGLARYAIVGIGVNVSQCEGDIPPELAESATSLMIACGGRVPLGIELLAKKIMDAFSEDCLALGGYGHCATRADPTFGRASNAGGIGGTGNAGDANGTRATGGAGSTDDSSSAGGTGGSGTTGSAELAGNAGSPAFCAGSPLHSYYTSRCVNIGREIEAFHAGERFRATGRGISPEGHLIVELPGGERRELASGEASVRGLRGYAT